MDASVCRCLWFVYADSTRCRPYLSQRLLASEVSKDRGISGVSPGTSTGRLSIPHCNPAQRGTRHPYRLFRPVRGADGRVVRVIGDAVVRVEVSLRWSPLEVVLAADTRLWHTGSYCTHACYQRRKQATIGRATGSAAAAAVRGCFVGSRMGMAQWQTSLALVGRWAGGAAGG